MNEDRFGETASYDDDESGELLSFRLASEYIYLTNFLTG